MDTMPPQAPPALVAGADDVTATTLQQLADIQHWLIEQQQALPKPSAVANDGQRYLDAMDAFWHAPIEHQGEAMTRRQAFAGQLAQLARHDANLLAGDGLLSTDAQRIVALSVAAWHAGSPWPANLHASALHTGGGPLGGALVLYDDNQPETTLLFTSRSGWHEFASLDEVLRHVFGDVARDTAHAVDVGHRPFEQITDTLIDQQTQGIQQTSAVGERLGEQVLQDALGDAVDLHRLMDVHDVLAWRNAVADAAMLELTLADARPKRSVGSASSTLTGSLGGAFGRRVTSLLRVPVLRRDLPQARTVFDRRFIAQDVVTTEATEAANGTFNMRGGTYIRQDGQFYQVRFDAGMQGWRLTRPGALDAYFSGPLIQRLPDGRWQIRSSGLLGGHRGSAAPYHVSAEDWELYRPYLSEAIGDFHVTEYTLLRQRLARTLGLREETVFNALGMRPTATPGEAVAAPGAGLAPHEVELFHVLVAGVRDLRTTRLTGYGTWRPEPDALRAAQRQGVFAPLPNLIPDAALIHFRSTAMPQLADMSPNEMRTVIDQLRLRAGEVNALRIFTTLGRRPRLGDELAAVLPEELSHWSASLNHIRAMRAADQGLAAMPGPSNPAPSAVEPLLELVPESEWPDVAYYYATPYELERFRHADTLMLSQARPAQSPVQGVPLMTQAPGTLLTEAGNVPEAWLPRTPISRATLPPETTALGHAAGAWVRIELRRMLPPRTALGAALGHPYRLYRQSTEHGPMLVLRQADPSMYGWWNPAIFIHGGNFSIHFWPAP